VADETVKAWQRITRELVASLPGEWSIARSGVKTALIKKPVEWTVLWIGISRVRRDENPVLMGGITPLVRAFNDLSVSRGLTTPVRPGDPRSYDMTAPDAADDVRRFTEAVLTTVADWTPARLAEKAEEQFAELPDVRAHPITFIDAAGWRVVLDSGDPVEPARAAVEWFEKAASPANVSWYRDLIGAWESGGRDAALDFLEANRAAALESLKIK
jgi:hypothetical protein